jgi:hypothetical protein
LCKHGKEVADNSTRKSLLRVAEYARWFEMFSIVPAAVIDLIRRRVPEPRTVTLALQSQHQRPTRRVQRSENSVDIRQRSGRVFDRVANAVKVVVADAHEAGVHRRPQTAKRLNAAADDEQGVADGSHNNQRRKNKHLVFEESAYKNMVDTRPETSVCECVSD